MIIYDIDAEEYVHQIGRTGRVGNPGRSTAFFTDDDAASATTIIEARMKVRILTQLTLVSLCRHSGVQLSPFRNGSLQKPRYRN